jgi:D-arabinose 1-dehydrogenase-like Zn-dependent alcohol dehydrogenase
MNLPHGSTIVVEGLGGLGHLAIQYARKMGYRTVALSRDSSKKEFATQLGATDYIDASQGDIAAAIQKLGGADLVVTTAGNAGNISTLIGGLAPLGKLLLLARKFIPGAVYSYH